MTDERMNAIKQLKECADDNGGYLSTILYQQSHRKPSCPQIIHLFGTWNNALKQAGVMLKVEFHSYCAEIIHTFKMEYPNNPNPEVYDLFIQERREKKYPSSKQIIRAIGTWKTVLKEADAWDWALSIYSRENCIKYINKCAELSNGKTTISDYKQFRSHILESNIYENIPTTDIVTEIFGSWTQAIKESNTGKVRAKLLLNFIEKEKENKANLKQNNSLQYPYHL